MSTPIDRRPGHVRVTRVPSREGPGTIRILSLACVLLFAATAATQDMPVELPWPFTLSREPFERLGNRGYAPAAFDPLARTNRREVGQAENLAALLADETARVVVFAGRHHISEESGEWTPMGSVLKARTGIDPLTVDLMIMEELTRPEHEHPARRAAIAAGLVGDVPAVLFDDAGEPYSALPGALDMVVFFPAAKDVAGRPDWLHLNGLRRPVAPELDVEPASELLGILDALDGPTLLQALVGGEDEQLAVPADQVVIEPGEARKPLLLRDGAYMLRLVDAEGEIHWRGRVEVTR
ncbi:MAG: hypothetical protein ACYTG2_16795 [Planctomycetota bacterium]